ncbi:hypothetical protein CDIK_0012 [Cucumispora dikerogammari]|nr:hypothetical protein CDIK_0012 [Cucumispora dikerogammari]
MNEEFIKDLFRQKRLSYLFCTLSYPRKFSPLDSISYLLRVSFLIELSLKQYIDLDLNTNNVVILNRTDELFYRDFLNKIEQKPMTFKKIANALNGELFSIKYSSLNIKKLRQRLFCKLKECKMIIDYKMGLQKITVYPNLEVKAYLTTKILFYLLNVNEDDLFMNSLCILLGLSGTLKDVLESLNAEQLTVAENKLTLINKKIMNMSGFTRPESIVFAFLRQAKK